MSEGGSFAHQGLHVGTDGRAWCITYPDSKPIFHVSVGCSTVAVTAKGDRIGTAAVEFARALARSAQRFADETERIHAAQLAEYTDSSAA